MSDLVENPEDLFSDNEAQVMKVTGLYLTLCLPVLSADNLGKQFGPNHRA